MKRSELISQLLNIPGDDPEVRILDSKYNLQEDHGEGSSAGIFPIIVEHMTMEEIPEGGTPWIALSFDHVEFDPPDHPEECPWCNGTGKGKASSKSDRNQEIICIWCDGSGHGSGHA